MHKLLAWNATWRKQNRSGSTGPGRPDDRIRWH